MYTIICSYILNIDSEFIFHHPKINPLEAPTTYSYPQSIVFLRIQCYARLRAIFCPHLKDIPHYAAHSSEDKNVFLNGCSFITICLGVNFFSFTILVYIVFLSSVNS